MQDNTPEGHADKTGGRVALRPPACSLTGGGTAPTSSVPEQFHGNEKQPSTEAPTGPPASGFRQPKFEVKAQQA
eukprot:5714718-Alexandrium_andersonii.AAC.1